MPCSRAADPPQHSQHAWPGRGGAPRERSTCFSFTSRFPRTLARLERDQPSKYNGGCGVCCVARPVSLCRTESDVDGISSKHDLCLFVALHSREDKMLAYQTPPPTPVPFFFFFFYLEDETASIIILSGVLRVKTASAVAIDRYRARIQRAKWERK